MVRILLIVCAASKEVHILPFFYKTDIRQTDGIYILYTSLLKCACTVSVHGSKYNLYIYI